MILLRQQKGAIMNKHFNVKNIFIVICIVVAIVAIIAILKGFGAI